eukprot:4680538-Alexandrium_andersonii.AAC.1
MHASFPKSPTGGGCPGGRSSTRHWPSPGLDGRYIFPPHGCIFAATETLSPAVLRNSKHCSSNDFQA